MAAQGLYGVGGGGVQMGLSSNGRALSAEERRREERNRREQSRSNKIAQQIEMLRDLLFKANYDGQFGKSATNKHNVLAATADYIRQLKEHNQEARAALHAPLPTLAPNPPSASNSNAPADDNSTGAAAATSTSSGSSSATAVSSADSTDPKSASAKQEQQRMQAVVVEQSETESQTSNSDNRQDTTGKAMLASKSSSKEVLNDGDYNHVFATSAVNLV
jgi:hypothetical protein